jgi:hypothetical protein
VRAANLRNGDDSPNLEWLDRAVLWGNRNPEPSDSQK